MATRIAGSSQLGRHQRLLEIVAERSRLLRRASPSGEDNEGGDRVDAIVGQDFYQRPRGEFFGAHPCRCHRDAETGARARDGDDQAAKSGGYWLLLLPPWLLPPCEWPMVEAWASCGTDETDRRSVIAGGVTAANLPHFFRNSRRSGNGVFAIRRI